MRYAPIWIYFVSVRREYVMKFLRFQTKIPFGNDLDKKYNCLKVDENDLE